MDRTRTITPEAAPPWLLLALVLALAGTVGAMVAAQHWTELLLYGVAAAIGAVLVVTDLREFRLPDRITLPAYPVLVALLALAAAATGRWDDFGRALLAAAVLFIGFVVLVLVLPSGFYFGDAKLGGLVGLVLGWSGWASVALGVLAAWVLLALTGLVLIMLRRADRRTELPFGPFLVLGVVIGIAWGASVFTSWA